MCVLTYVQVCNYVLVCGVVWCGVVCMCGVCRDVWAAGTWQHREAVVTKDGGTAHRQDCLPPGLWQLPHCKQLVAVGMVRIKNKNVGTLTW